MSGILILSFGAAFAGNWSTCMKTNGARWSQDLALFHSVEELDAAAAKQASLTMDEAAGADKSPYRNGTVKVIIRRLGIEEANLKHVTFLWVDAAGHKFGEVAGEDDIGEMPPAPGPLSGSGAYWWNVAVLSTPSSEAGIVLHVVDKLSAD
jgi:hypothetical protein